MLRNREIRILIIVLTVISASMIAVVYLFPDVAGIAVIIATLLILSTTLIFTRWRYREIEKLSIYLQKISSGDYTLDVRDNYEGELSILKNNIYKVTLMLAEQGELLKQDKIHLTEAISDISHQLKTPLTSMTVMTDLLSDAKLPDEKRVEFTHNISTQLERIEWLVTSLLKLSKIDAGTVTFKRDKINVKKLIEKALDPLRIPIEVKEQTIIVTGEEQVNFVGDTNWTAEALINILKNCVEHTQEGGTIELSFTENVLYTELIIKDNGKGIAKEDLPYLFNRFFKGKNASEDSIGIGMAMAHSIVTNQNGHLDVTSEQGRGTIFRIKFYQQITK